MNDFFKHGSCWVRADFHLHTKADKEFEDWEQQNSFKKAYIQKLKEEEVGVGLITNHNKFDLDEFKALRKQARKAQIYLLPGVELSVNDGANGIHCLIAFDYAGWLKNGENFIEQFLTAAFEGIANRENENTRCKYSLKEVLKSLHEHREKGRDSFIVLAHVHSRSGFFYEMSGGRITDFFKKPLFRQSILGFQKFRNYGDLEKVHTWLNKKVPAFLEGSDCKTMEQVGQAQQQSGIDKKCYLKLGAFSFEAVKFALIQHEERVASEFPPIQNLYIHKIEVERNNEEPFTLPLNFDLNTLIGVRGSGKSSLLEAVRFGLGIPPQGSSQQQDYKNQIVRRFLGLGNRLYLYLADANGEVQYTIRREWGKKPEVWRVSGEKQENLLPTKLLSASYYGQKDIEALGEGFDARYVEERLFREQLAELEEQEKQLVRELEQIFTQLKEAKGLRSQRDSIAQKIAALELEIQLFEKSGLQELVAKELNFAEDEGKLEQIEKELKALSERLLEVVTSYGWESYLSYEAKEAGNTAFFEQEVFPIIHCLMKFEQQVERQFEAKGEASLLREWKKVVQKFTQKKTSLQEEFRKAKQKIDNPDLDVEMHKDNKRALHREKLRLRVIEEKLNKAKHLEQELESCLAQLEEHRQKMFGIIETEVQKLNAKGLTFRIKVTYQGEKEEFKDWLFNQTNGLHRNNHIKKVVESYDSPIQIYRDLYEADSELARILRGGSLLERFRSSLEENLAFLSYKIPNRYQFFYNDKPLEHYSIGQKSTALIDFVLAHEDRDLFIIDQPEDDLDNYTVAQKIIKRIRELKPSTQFLFATHNPNILVLGDSEQVVVCKYHDEDNRIEVKLGSIDCASIQQTAINIMEGGQEAFDRRKNVYQLWKH